MFRGARAAWWASARCAVRRSAGQKISLAPARVVQLHFLRPIHAAAQRGPAARPDGSVAAAAAATAAAAAAVAALLLDKPTAHKVACCEERPTAGHEVKVVTYNVLAPLLCTAKHFPKCSVDAVSAEKRLPRLMARMVEETSAGAVISLQEVDLKWAGKLHAFFAEHGYCAVFAQYGRTFNGYMGVMVAWPREQFEALDVEISRIADTASRGTWPKPIKDDAPSLSRFGYVTYNGLKEILGCSPPELPQEDKQFEWNMAKGRANEAVFVRLRARGQPLAPSFCVGTYHMPCLFGTPEKVRVVNIHTYLLMARFRAFAGNDAAVLVGDFNFKPKDSPYLLATSGGSFEGARASSPEDVKGLEERLVRGPVPFPSGLKSAYVAYHGREPHFTNFAQTEGQAEPFVETLDYIWFTDGLLEVVDCPRLPESREAVQGPFPNQAEPSDHVLLKATLRLTGAQSSQL